MLNSSPYLQGKYSRPVYNSSNFRDHAWIRKDDTGRVVDPYRLLPPIFNDIPQSELDRMVTDNMLADGGAAMMAYAWLQFSDVPADEREAVRDALLRYCELDTFAMVIIWEAWTGRHRQASMAWL